MPVEADRVSWWNTSFQNGEAEAAARSIRDRNVSQGPVVREFERQLADYLQVPHVVATSSGSTALLLSLMACGVGPGDEVVVPNRTWIATAHAALLLGATVRTVDVEPGRPVIAVDRVSEVLSDRTRAIIGVHVNGRHADVDGLLAVADQWGIPVIEDAAQALGSRSQAVSLGTMSVAGCFSLSTAKIIATGQGGFVATRSSSIFDKIVAMRTHGVGDVMNPSWRMLGFNFRYTDVLASMGIVQLGLLDQRIERLLAIRERYRLAIEPMAGSGLELVDRTHPDGEVGPYIEILCERRTDFVRHMDGAGIETRAFYPNVDDAPYVERIAKSPNSDVFARHGVYLPSGPALTDAEIDRVVCEMHRFAERSGI